MTPIALTHQGFIDHIFDYENSTEWKYKGDLPAIIDFYADWCGPCKAIAPILEELAIEYDGRVIIYKVDTEKEQKLSGAFGIQSIPTLLFIPMNGQPMLQQGAIPKKAFREVIDARLLEIPPATS